MSSGRARAWFAITALAALVGLAVQVAVTYAGPAGYFPNPILRALNLFAFFTIETNLIVGATSLLLALDPHRGSALFGTLRLIGVVAIAITGIVYHVALADLHRLHGWALVADSLLHTVVPVLAIVGWLFFGPRGRTSLRVAGLSLLFPGLWLAFTLVRGAAIRWYPYPFLDPLVLGYGAVIRNCLWIGLVFLGAGLLAHVLDRRLPAGAPSPLPANVLPPA